MTYNSLKGIPKNCLYNDIIKIKLLDFSQCWSLLSCVSCYIKGIRDVVTFWIIWREILIVTKCQPTVTICQPIWSYLKSASHHLSRVSIMSMCNFINLATLNDDDDILLSESEGFYVVVWVQLCLWDEINVAAHFDAFTRSIFPAAGQTED